MQLTALLSRHPRIECPPLCCLPLLLPTFAWCFKQDSSGLLVFLRLHAAGDICISSGLAPLSSVALFAARQRVFRSTREKQSGICLPCQFALTSISRGEAKKGGLVCLLLVACLLLQQKRLQERAEHALLGVQCSPLKGEKG